ncbi:methyltransferase [Nonomuraea antimicrobica]|uniref:Methyltransferase n=1 Tax=Nonomuraea antimicrobica TaxID=561173 RepID=A0ABP7ENT3_9ACTN
MKIPDDVLAVLADPRVVIVGDRVQIPFELDRPLYEHVDRILRMAGARWDGRKKVRAHVFDHQTEEFMLQVIASAEFPSRYEQGWYPSPPAVVEQVLEHAGISDRRPGLTVLEPSAGTGCIAGPAAARGAVVDVVEIDARRIEVLRRHDFARRVIHGDFLADVHPLDYPEGFSRVVMNPPFDSAIAHVKHALGFLGDDAVLVAVMPEYVLWRSDLVTKKFRWHVKANDGEFVSLPRDAFTPSGVTVHSVLAIVPTGHEGCTVRNHSWHRSHPKQQYELFAI